MSHGVIGRRDVRRVAGQVPGALLRRGRAGRRMDRAFERPYWRIDYYAADAYSTRARAPSISFVNNVL